MKKLLTLIFAIALATNAIAQEDNKTPSMKKSDTVQETDQSSIVMNAGKVWLSKDGKTTVLENEIKLGLTTVKPDGTVILKDGNTIMLKDGDKVSSEGELVLAAKRDVPAQPEKGQK